MITLTFYPFVRSATATSTDTALHTAKNLIKMDIQL
nr:MAG TPA: hypothetical protein [Caudoviricetes sp.]